MVKMSLGSIYLKHKDMSGDLHSLTCCFSSINTPNEGHNLTWILVKYTLKRSVLWRTITVY